VTVYFSSLKVLDAPDLRDDFHLNVLDWSAQNVISLGLEKSIYIYDVSTRRVEKLCDVSGDGDFITSVAWNEQVS
jgi:cell division cycle 20-like protein 1 (cofactor of APC complex)